MYQLRRSAGPALRTRVVRARISFAMRPADREPDREQPEPGPPVPGGQHDAGEDPGEPVAGQRDDHHRRPGRIGVEQAALGGGELVLHPLVLERLDPDRGARRPDQRGAHPRVDARGHRRGQGVLERSAQQRQRVDPAGERERADQRVAGRRGQAAEHRGRDVAGDPTHRDEYQHGQATLGDHEGDSEEAERRRRLPHQVQRPQARSDGDPRSQRRTAHTGRRLRGRRARYHRSRRIVRYVICIAESLPGKALDRRQGGRRGLGASRQQRADR